ncbi:MAG TPA: twin-arginine translocation signal domain-containing protein, partial [Acidimicrobiales bacterium]|nr:twin-arginine translocation signal domain-containing protein [Acidimicrobiales bacterium]
MPLPPGPVSNGEFVPTEPTAHDRAVAHRIRAEVDDAARRQGIDRRRFLQTAGAVAASLATFELAGCSNPVGQKARPPTSGTSATSAPTTSAPGGTFNVPPTTDHEACAVALNGDGEFIFDVHTHHVMPGASWTTDAPETVDLVLGMLPAGCTQEPQLDCVDRAAYLHDLFLASDTTMAMLTDVPNSGPSDAPVPFPQELVTKQLVTDLTHGGAARLLVQNIVAPNVVGLAAT